METSNIDFGSSLNCPWSSNDDDFFDYCFRLYMFKWKSSKLNRKQLAKIYSEINSTRPTNPCLHDQIKRKYLADRVLQCDHLLKIEKEEICFFLTGEKPFIKSKGSSNFTVRDTVMAFEYLIKSFKGFKITETRQELKMKYGVPEENTFYKAINRGIENIKSINDCGKVHAEKNNILTSTETALLFMIHGLALEAYGLDCVEIILKHHRELSAS